MALDAEQTSLLIPAGTRVEVPDMEKGMVVSVLVFDEDCHLLTPVAIWGSPFMQPGLVAFIDGDGVAAWGDTTGLTGGADVPEDQASSVGCDR